LRSVGFLYSSQILNASSHYKSAPEGAAQVGIEFGMPSIDFAAMTIKSEPSSAEPNSGRNAGSGGDCRGTERAGYTGNERNQTRPINAGGGATPEKARARASGGGGGL
jgi:hypothetical protein